MDEILNKMNSRLENLIQKQIEFEKFVSFPIDSILESDRNKLSEIFIFKLIEELIELRKEAPSVMNPWSKSNKPANLLRIREELSDVSLFFLNLLITWRISPLDLLSQTEITQQNNFDKVKEKKLNQLNAEILAIPGYTSGIGHGVMSPKFIFVGQNPGVGVEHGYKFWSVEGDGSSRVLLPAIEKLGIMDQSYFTNFVKCITVGNGVPTKEMFEFWWSYFEKEINILSTSNKPIVVAMGNVVDEELTKRQVEHRKIPHPAIVLRGTMTVDEYNDSLKSAAHRAIK